MDSTGDASDDRPTVKLRPGRGRRLAEGAPGAAAGQVAMDRRTKRLPGGALVRLVEGERVLGLAAFNSASQIAARLIAPDPEAAIDAGWFAGRFAKAL